MGHTVTNYPTPECDIILVNSWSRGKGKYINLSEFEQIRRLGKVTSWGKWIPAWVWKRLSQQSIPVVHRVDGVAKLYGRNDAKADRTQFKIANVANHVIFQSAYSMKSFAKFGIHPKNTSIVSNGVDGDIFYPLNKKNNKPPEKIKLVANSWSMNPFKGFQLLPTLANHPKIELSFIGRWLKSVDSGEVNLLGSKTPNEIGEILRGADAFVHAAKNDPCPNVVQEALACGLPIIYLNSGGTKELAADYGIPLAESTTQVVESLLENYTLLRDKILFNRPKFLASRAAKAYVDVFDQLLSSPLI